jgi:hypothetical protein
MQFLENWKVKKLNTYGSWKSRALKVSEISTSAKSVNFRKWKQQLNDAAQINISLTFYFLLTGRTRRRTNDLRLKLLFISANFLKYIIFETIKANINLKRSKCQPSTFRELVRIQLEEEERRKSSCGPLTFGAHCDVNQNRGQNQRGTKSE